VKKNDSWSMLGIAWEMGYLIVIPLLLFSLGGKFLDKKINSAPWFFLIGIILAIFFTTYLIYKKLNNYLGLIEKQSNKKRGKK